MAFTHKIVRTWQDSAGRSLVGSVSESGQQEDNLSVTVPDNTNDTEILAINYSGLKSLYLLVTGRDDVTVTFQKTGPATEKVYTPKGGVPVVWSADDENGASPAAVNPFTANIIDVLIAVPAASGPDAQIEIRVLQDS